MPKQAEPAKHPDATYHLVVRIPGWLKNELLLLARREGVGMARYAETVLFRAVRDAQGIPAPPPARVALPTTADQIRAWATGEVLSTPCGRVGSCTGTDETPRRVGGLGFCRECEIRLE